MLLKNDVSEFLPYAFQLLAQLLELYPAPGPGGSSLSEGFIRLLPTATLAKLWTKPGNVPALTMLVQAYMRRGFGYLSTHRDQLLNVLGVWQNVLAMKNLEDNAFAIADAMCASCRGGGACARVRICIGVAIAVRSSAHSLVPATQSRRGRARSSLSTCRPCSR